MISIEHLWIPMPDGVRLSARIWRPDEADAVPAVLEYIPYRKRDLVRLRDERNHPFLAKNGYACLRVDMRGSGDSEGHMPDMYSQHELDDARHVIDWIASQPWCNGRVGMFGTSWGGTASLQASVNAPEALKAVLANCATVDRFEDDIHWMGGCLLTDSLEWGATLPSILACPPDIANLGEAWMAIWKDRLEQLSFPLEQWASHDLRGKYWRHGSTIFDAEAISCPVLMVGGWADRYANNVIKLVSARPDLCRGIIGPWGHHYPDKGEPGPAINFQKLALEWWDKWLKASDNQHMSSYPALTVWQCEHSFPKDRIPLRQGQWLNVHDVTDTESVCFHLDQGTLVPSAPKTYRLLEVPFDLSHGRCSGDTGYFGRVGGMPLDQAPDDARALTFDSEILQDDFELFGHCELHIDIAVETMPAQIACRLCDVTEDGVSNLVTRTVLSLDLDETLDNQLNTKPGQMQRYKIKFPAMAYRFRPGSRLRLALGASYWPLVWPVSKPASLEINTKEAVLILPQTPIKSEAANHPFEPAMTYEGDTQYKTVSAGNLERTYNQTDRGHVHQGWHQPKTKTIFTDLGFTFSVTTTTRYDSTGNDPESVRYHIINRYDIERQDGTASIESKLTMRATDSGYEVMTHLTAGWNDVIMLDRKHVFQKQEKRMG